MSSYTYRPIDPNSNTIRLVRLFQGHQYDEPLCCELFEAPLPDERDDTYDALSYYWGNPLPTAKIVVNGQEMPVRENLRDALLHLRNPNTDRILWADASCINQQDDLERNQQVLKMGSIYQRAWEVVVWFGKTNYGIDLLFETIRDLDEIFRQYPKPPDDAEHLNLWIDEGLPFASFRKSLSPNLYEIRQRALNELLNRSWFRRIWVVQEAAYASVATIQCSWTSVPTRTFCIMPFIMEVGVDAGTQPLLDVLPGPLKQNSWWNNDRSLGTILTKFWGRESSDPRDQIFALLGLSNDLSKDGRSLQPDYTIEIWEAIQRTVYFLCLRKIPDSNSCRNMPRWNLEEFREKLPSLQYGIFSDDEHMPFWRQLVHKKVHSDISQIKTSGFLDQLLSSQLEGTKDWSFSDSEDMPLFRQLNHNTLHFDANQKFSTEFLNWLPLENLISKRKHIDEIRVVLERKDLDANHARRALNFATAFCRPDVVHELFARENADRMYRRKDIRLALKFSVKFGHCQLLNVILSAVGHSRELLPHKELIGLLQYAAQYGNTAAIKMLIENGVHPDATCSFGDRTALMVATENKHVEAVELLVQRGADVNYKDKSVFWELYLAGQRQIWRLRVRLSVKIGANIIISARMRHNYELNVSVARS